MCTDIPLTAIYNVSINQVLYLYLLYFPRYCQDKHHWHLSIDQVSLKTLFVLFKIWPVQASVINNKWLRGDNSIHIQGKYMVLVHCPSSDCHLYIYQVSFKFLLNFPRYGPDKQPLYIQGRIMFVLSLPSISKPSLI